MIEPASPAPIAADAPAPGLVVYQPRRGYRWGVEVYALVDFALRAGPVATAADLGTGSGVLAMLLGWTGARVWAVDREPLWLELARRGVAESGLDARVTVVEADIRAPLPIPRVDLVVANPPWFAPAAGPISPDPWKAGARAMLAGGPAEFAAAALSVAPRACLVLRRERLRDLHDFAMTRRASLGGKVVLVELVRGPPGATLVDEALDLESAYRRFGR